jgi:hypothetical protein
MDYEALKNILNANQGKNFVRRILNPEAYPVMDFGKGQIASASNGILRSRAE